jgi:hypothetical protein
MLLEIILKMIDNYLYKINKEKNTRGGCRLQEVQTWHVNRAIILGIYYIWLC